MKLKNKYYSFFYRSQIHISSVNSINTKIFYQNKINIDILKIFIRHGLKKKIYNFFYKSIALIYKNFLLFSTYYPLSDKLVFNFNNFNNYKNIVYLINWSLSIIESTFFLEISKKKVIVKKRLENILSYNYKYLYSGKRRLKSINLLSYFLNLSKNTTIMLKLRNILYNLIFLNKNSEMYLYKKKIYSMVLN